MPKKNAGIQEFAWAVCPRPDDLHSTTKEPRLFRAERDARRFVNSKVREPSVRKTTEVYGISVDEVLEHRARFKSARDEAVRKLKRGEIHPAAFPQEFVEQRRKHQGWGEPVPIIGVQSGVKPARLFKDFLPIGELGVVRAQDLEGLIGRVLSERWPQYTCLLAKEWRFDEIEKDAMKRVGHEFEGRKHGSIAEIVLKSLYDFEHSLSLFHPNASREAIARFWTSWDLQRHLAEFTERIKESPTAISLSNEPRGTARAAREQLNVQLAAYAHEIASAVVPRIPSAETKPAEHDCNRKADVASFLSECNARSSTRIFKRHIWLSVGHTKGRQFEYWQSCDARSTNSDEVNFQRIINTKPADFVALLRQKGLIPRLTQ